MSTRYRFQRFGYLHDAEMELGSLTLICGKNNTGKTYANHALYGFFERWRDLINLNLDSEVNTLYEKGILEIDLSKYEHVFYEALGELSSSFSQYLPKIFSVSEDYFASATFSIEPGSTGFSFYSASASARLAAGSSDNELIRLSKEKNSSILTATLIVEDSFPILPKEVVKNFLNGEVAKILGGEFFPRRAFIVTSERTGVSLFYKELDISKNVILEDLQNSKRRIEPHDFFRIFEAKFSRYSLPVKDEIDFIRDIETITKKKSELCNTSPELFSLLRDIVGGEYELDGDDSIRFLFEKETSSVAIPLHVASSTVKSLINMDRYLRHIAQPGDILIVDEPELNLHPANQRKLARLFSRLLKCGVKILMTTHSDYLIKELNNLIVLSNRFPQRERLMEDYGYTEDDVLRKEEVKVYISDRNTLIPASINETGIEVQSFDEEISEMNKFYDEATLSLELSVL